MSETILLIFEGRKTEPQIFKNIRDKFFGNDPKSILQAVYGTDIYQLWNDIKDDKYLDILEVLRELSPENSKALDGIGIDDISQVFLFFDYDGHAVNASDEIIKNMLNHFNEETENGKLYISYPMVEALKDVNNTTLFKDNAVPAKENIGYKKIVGDSTKYMHINNISRNDWNDIIKLNLSKANFIINHDYSFPENNISQNLIFEAQLKYFIEPRSKVSVLSSFPFYISEYFGILSIKQQLTE